MKPKIKFKEFVWRFQTIEQPTNVNDTNVWEYEFRNVGTAPARINGLELPPPSANQPGLNILRLPINSCCEKDVSTYQITFDCQPLYRYCADVFLDWQPQPPPPQNATMEIIVNGNTLALAIPLNTNMSAATIQTIINAQLNNTGAFVSNVQFSVATGLRFQLCYDQPGAAPGLPAEVRLTTPVGLLTWTGTLLFIGNVSPDICKVQIITKVIANLETYYDASSGAKCE